MSLQPAILPIPVPVLSEQPAVTTFRASDETACSEPIGSHFTQKGEEAATDKIANDPEKVLSSEDEFPDGGLRAWAVVLGVGSGSDFLSMVLLMSS
jgi:hypothetical protein